MQMSVGRCEREGVSDKKKKNKAMLPYKISLQLARQNPIRMSLNENKKNTNFCKEIIHRGIFWVILSPFFFHGRLQYNKTHFLFLKVRCHESALYFKFNFFFLSSCSFFFILFFFLGGKRLYNGVAKTKAKGPLCKRTFLISPG